MQEYTTIYSIKIDKNDFLAIHGNKRKFCLKFKQRPKKGHQFETEPNSCILVAKFRCCQILMNIEKKKSLQ